MPGNQGMELVSERGWRRGLTNLLDNELARWWKTRMWWIQCLIWTSFISFMLGSLFFGAPDFSLQDAVMLYSIFAGMFPAVGVVIIMQGALVGEKQAGTAAWVMSKPAARPAFILSKLAASSLGVLATMVVMPGLAAYILFWIRTGSPFNPAGFLAALGVIFLNQLFYLTLTLMLGACFDSRGPVIGIALGFLFTQQYMVGALPILKYVLPWTLVDPGGSGQGTIIPALLSGQPVASSVPLLAVAVECILFTLVALWRFRRQEL